MSIAELSTKPSRRRTRATPPTCISESERSRQLKIFLSHKLGASRTKAKRVASALSVLANDRMRVVFSADFERGEQWENEIRRGLDQAHWFILLYDGPDTNHDWCLWEAGYFRAQMGSAPERRLICLHDPRHRLPGPLQGFASVPAREEEVFQLFRQIYLDDPWRLKPELFAEADHSEIHEKVRRVIAEVSHGDEVVAQYTISPTFTFHVSNENLPRLQEAQIPSETVVSGDGPWEQAFGRPEATIAWTWGGLVQGLEDWKAWSHQLAAMMNDSLRYLSIPHPSMALRIKLRSGTESIHRVILRRIEKTREECRFTFAAARIVTAYQPNNHVRETLIFHLYNLAWFFRHQFLEKHIQFLSEINDLTNPPPDRIEEEIRSIEDDLKALEAEAQVRGVENPSKLIRAFDEPLRSRVKVKLLEDWPKLDGELRTACRLNPRDLTAIIRAIASMDEINRYFIETCLRELSELGPGDVGI